jgi:endogenous inhibitor of DNA gyrase (YacG/DUF329 family)
MLDLGTWATEAYRIRVEEETDLEHGGENPPPRSSG